MEKKHKMLSLSKEVIEELDKAEVHSHLVEELLREEFGMESKYREKLLDDRMRRTQAEAESEEVSA